jgi:hypothetical protein
VGPVPDFDLFDIDGNMGGLNMDIIPTLGTIQGFIDRPPQSLLRYQSIVVPA